MPLKIFVGIEVLIAGITDVLPVNPDEPKVLIPIIDEGDATDIIELEIPIGVNSANGMLVPTTGNDNNPLIITPIPDRALLIIVAVPDITDDIGDDTINPDDPNPDIPIIIGATIADAAKLLILNPILDKFVTLIIDNMLDAFITLDIGIPEAGIIDDNPVVNITLGIVDIVELTPDINVPTNNGVLDTQPLNIAEPKGGIELRDGTALELVLVILDTIVLKSIPELIIGNVKLLKYNGLIKEYNIIA